MDIGFGMADIGFSQVTPVGIVDVFGGKSVGHFVQSYTAKAVPSHGTVLLRVSYMGY